VSKAFTFEEAPQGAARCPGCGRAGTLVPAATVEALVPAEAQAGLGSEPHFCATPTCDVGYFDALGRAVPTTALRALGYPKRTDAAALVCHCFGVAVSEVTQERVAEVRARLDRGEGRCDRVNPAGRRCVADLLRLLRAPRL
jgi:Zinc binding domain